MSQLNADEYYFYTFLKRLKDYDYRMAFTGYFPKDFPKKAKYSDRLEELLNGLCANWVLKNFFNKGGWKKKLWYIDSTYKKGYAWDFDIKFDLSYGLIRFFRDVLGLWYQERDENRTPNRKYSPADKILIHIFTQELFERRQKNFISIFTEHLRANNLNSFLFGDIFLDQEIKFDSLSKEELFYIQGANEVIVISFKEWCSSLRYKTPTTIAADLDHVMTKLNSMMERVREKDEWFHVFYLVEIYEQILLQGLLNHETYLVNASKSDFEDEVERNNYLLDIAGVWETFQGQFQRLASSFQNISFVDPNYEYVKEFVKVLKRHHTPNVVKFDTQLQALYKEAEGDITAAARSAETSEDNPSEENSNNEEESSN